MKQGKPLKKNSQKRKQRKEIKTQVDAFTAVYNQQGGRCLLTGDFIPMPNASCYPHLLPKGSYPKLMEDESNIVLVKYYLHDVIDTIMTRLKEEYGRDNIYIRICNGFDMKKLVKEEYIRMKNQGLV